MATHQGTGSDHNVLWFTSTMSTEMHENKVSTFAGLYKCNLNKETGTCDQPELVVDKFDSNGVHHRGLDLMNVALDETQSFLYTGYYRMEKGMKREQENFEILRAPVTSDSTSTARGVELESFFRTERDVRNNICILQCCEDADETYFQVQPRDYVLDGDDIFVSWDGFYQDCADPFEAKKGLKWTIGVSKIKKTPECVLNGGMEPVHFHDCTTPVSILYQEGTRGNVLLGYAGIATSLSPSGKRVFYLSGMDNQLGVDELTGKPLPPLNEIWTMPEGENYAKNPSALHRMGAVEIARPFIEHAVDDVGTIRLRLDENRIPTGMCRTVYDAGVVCHSLNMHDETNIEITSTRTYVDADQLAESCTVVSDHYPITKILPPVSTGLEVLWEDNSPDDEPSMLFFGCYGEINAHGNFSTAFPDGTIRQTMKGGFPGSILFGVETGSLDMDSSGISPGSGTLTGNSTSGFQIFSSWALGAMALISVAMYLVRRRAPRRYGQDYEVVFQSDSVELSSPSHSDHVYVELAESLEENV